MLKYELINSTEVFKSLKTEWNNLLNNSNVDSIFLTWEWQFNWWNSFKSNKTLSIIIVRDNKDNKLLGIAPLYKAKKQIFKAISISELKFIGDDDNATSEYLDFICLKERDRKSVV